MLVGQLMGHAEPRTSMGYVALTAPGGDALASMFPDAA